jgi:hypothetical protein
LDPKRCAFKTDANTQSKWLTKQIQQVDQQLLGSKPVPRDRCCDEMIDKRATLPWGEAQDQPRRGAKENENGAHAAELSSSHPHKAPEIITTVPRKLIVICPHLGEKKDTRNNPYHTKYTTKHTASGRIYHSEATTKRPGLRQVAQAYGKSYNSLSTPQAGWARPIPTEPFGRIRPLIPSRGTRPIDTKDNKAPEKPDRAPKNYRVTRALLCCACMFTVLTLACTHDPLAEFYPARENPLPHLADSTDPQDGHQLRDNKEIRREDQADMPRVGSETQAAKRQRA